MILDVIQTGLAILLVLGLFGTAFSILLEMEKQKDTDRKGKAEENDSSRSI
jgi:hypothetical protein